MKHAAALIQQPAGALHRDRLKAFLGVALAALLLAGLPGLAPARAQSSAALPAVVVWDFDNQTPGAAGLGGPGSATDFLRRSLSENLTAALLQVAGLPVLERQRLKDLLAEQKVSATELADEDARVRLGRIVGAGRMVFGGFFVLGDQVQIHVRVVDTATSRVLFSDEAATGLGTVMQQVEPLNRRLARALGAGAAPGQTFAAASWQAYDQALALADAGKLDEAVVALQALLGKDKGFVPAERQLVALLDKLSRR
jgi:curli biogenesis system outer membrane secretion channel CsgG